MLAAGAMGEACAATEEQRRYLRGFDPATDRARRERPIINADARAGIGNRFPVFPGIPNH